MDAVPPSLGLEPAELDGLIDAALGEDLGAGDVTTAGTVPPGARARGLLLGRARGVLAGLGVFARVFERVSGTVRVELLASDGDAVAPGDVVARLDGPAEALLIGERTALNFLQRLSGTATLTAAFVERAGRARILDTRKTTPLLRALQKYAVRCGGGENHRIGLYDQAMIKDNHLDLSGRGLGELVRALRGERPELVVTAEARDEAEALDAARAGAHVVLLDNFTPDELAALCSRVRGAAEEAGHAVELEASGGIDLENVAAYGATGVDRISVGALTHSAPALDFSLALEPDA